MLLELSVRQLGVIEELTVVLGPGMTALTGETGAGKTLVVEALELLVGGRADAVMVRRGAREALVEGRFDQDGEEVVVARAVPVEGRSRAWVNGRMAPVASLAELGGRLVDLHGQHAHQSLLRPEAQRAVLDAFVGADRGPTERAREELRSIERGLASLGGDARARAREIDLLAFQREEIESAAITGATEDEILAGEEERLAGAGEHREAAMAAGEALRGEGRGAVDAVGAAVAAVGGRGPFAEIESRLRAAEAELADVAADLRGLADSLHDDPERLLQVRSRRQLLRQLMHKYGESLEEVTGFAAAARLRLEELESTDERAAAMEEERRRAAAALAEAHAVLGATRRHGADGLARAVEDRLAVLAMPGARLEVVVGEEEPGDDVTLLLRANAGERALPLSRVASGGELARCLLATRLVAGGGAPTLVFDEVEAGVGGEAALAVGRALSSLATEHQVVVVTHLAQVAAFADAQVAVTKSSSGGRTVARAQALGSDQRVVELSRMLSGHPGSAAARRHAAELLAVARPGGRTGGSGLSATLGAGDPQVDLEEDAWPSTSS